MKHKGGPWQGCGIRDGTRWTIGWFILKEEPVEFAGYLGQGVKEKEKSRCLQNFWLGEMETPFAKRENRGRNKFAFCV